MDSRQFRNAMGKFATGVTVVLTEVDGTPHGMTANAFMSVSLDPMLVVVSIGNKARILNKIRQTKKFTVNILSADQQEISMIFAGQLVETRKVSFERLGDQPVIPGALAQVVCAVTAEHAEGDHTLFIGKVLNIHLEESGEPLIYYKGGYRYLTQDTSSLH